MRKPLQHLEFNAMQQAASDYFEAGMLTAQSPATNNAQCVNAGYGGRRCAVAAGFNIALLAAKPEGSIDGIISAGYATTDNFAALVIMQKVHDAWATAVVCHGHHDARTIKLRELFSSCLNTRDASYPKKEDWEYDRPVPPHERGDAYDDDDNN